MQRKYKKNKKKCRKNAKKTRKNAKKFKRIRSQRHYMNKFKENNKIYRKSYSLFDLSCWKSAGFCEPELARLIKNSKTCKENAKKKCKQIKKNAKEKPKNWKKYRNSFVINELFASRSHLLENSFFV